MTERCIQNLSAVLKAAGSDISKVVKVNVFLTSMDNFAEMNATYEGGKEVERVGVGLEVKLTKCSVLGKHRLEFCHCGCMMSVELSWF